MAGEIKTVRDLVMVLSKFDPELPVASVLHSDFDVGVDAWEMDLQENGGYLSRPYPPILKETRRYVVVA